MISDEFEFGVILSVDIRGEIYSADPAYPTAGCNHFPKPELVPVLSVVSFPEAPKCTQGCVYLSYIVGTKQITPLALNLWLNPWLYTYRTVSGLVQTSPTERKKTAPLSVRFKGKKQLECVCTVDTYSERGRI